MFLESFILCIRTCFYYIKNENYQTTVYSNCTQYPYLYFELFHKCNNYFFLPACADFYCLNYKIKKKKKYSWVYLQIK